MSTIVTKIGLLLFDQNTVFSLQSVYTSEGIRLSPQGWILVLRLREQIYVLFRHNYFFFCYWLINLIKIWFLDSYEDAWYHLIIVSDGSNNWLRHQKGWQGEVPLKNRYVPSETDLEIHLFQCCQIILLCACYVIDGNSRCKSCRGLIEHKMSFVAQWSIHGHHTDDSLRKGR